MSPEEIDQIEARALAASDGSYIEPRGVDKYYGVNINNPEWNNPLIIMGTQEEEYPEGDAAHSEREPEKKYSHNALGGHYESVRDLANAVHLTTARADILALVGELRRRNQQK